MKIEFSGHIVKKSSNIKLREYPSMGAEQYGADGQT